MQSSSSILYLSSGINLSKVNLNYHHNQYGHNSNSHINKNVSRPITLSSGIILIKNISKRQSVFTKLLIEFITILYLPHSINNSKV